MGSDGSDAIDVVVEVVADYLLGPRRATGSGSAPGRPTSSGEGGGASRYYADTATEAGRWLGIGAAELGLDGDVDRDEFRVLLGGRDPRSGRRLITARGSAGRVPTVGVGSAARWGSGGGLLYSLADVATSLGWSRPEVTAAVDAGEALAARRLLDWWCSQPTAGASGSDGVGVVLVPWVDSDGTRYVGEAEMARVDALVGTAPTASELASRGPSGEELSLREAAAEVGVSRSYLQRLCRVYERHRGDIDARVAAGEPVGRAFVAARRDSGGAWRVTRAALADFAARRRRPAVRVAYDVTATTEKSFSVLGLLGGAELRGEVLAAVQAANDVGLGWLERHAAAARFDCETVGVTGWTVASFRHLTSRRLDPFVHHHNVIPNSVVDEHGVRRALDARRLYRSTTAVSAIATAEARFQLTSRLGVAYRPARHGGWEIAGIDDAVIDGFSQRLREVREAMREFELALGRGSTLRELHAVVRTTRPPKDSSVDHAQLLARWWQRAEDLGLSVETLEACVGRARPTVLTRELRRRVLAELAVAVTAHGSIFTRSQVLATLVDLPAPDDSGQPLIVAARTLETIADDFLASDTVVPLAATTGHYDLLQRNDGTMIPLGGDREPEYTTDAMLAIQARTLERYASRQACGAAQLDHDVVEAVLGDFAELTGEQRHLVKEFCSSGDGVQSAIGHPGSGKTHAMRAAAAAWQQAGYQVLGAAVKAEAARHLGSECGIAAEPLAWYLARLNGDPLTSPLDARTVLVVDEAGTIADRDLERLLAGAETAAAAVRLIGDPAQHGAVAAGGLWYLLTQRWPQRTPKLTIGQRVEHPADQAAAHALRQGRAADALAYLETAGHLHIVADERRLYAALVDEWWQARARRQPHPMVARRHDQRLVLNRIARLLRRQLDELGDVEITAAGERRFAAGDEVVARMGERSLHPPDRPHAYVRNGSHGTVVDVHGADDPTDDRISVDFDGIATIDLPRGFFDEHRHPSGRVDVGLDHAYAVTSYAVQGLTFDQSTSVIDPRSSRPEVYVDITRGRRNRLFLTAAEDRLDGERLPAAPELSDRHRVENRLARSRPEITALEVDRLAGPAALHARGKTLAALTRERLRANGSEHAALIGHAERIRQTHIARRGRARPDPHLTSRLVTRPAESYLAARYDTLLGNIGVYRARWNPPPAHNTDWAWALGEPLNHPQAAQERQRLVDALRDLSVDAVTHRLWERVGGLSPAGRDLVHRLGAAGVLGHLDPQHIAAALDHLDAHPRPSSEHVQQLAEQLANIHRDVTPPSVADRGSVIDGPP